MTADTPEARLADELERNLKNGQHRLTNIEARLVIATLRASSSPEALTLGEELLYQLVPKIPTESMRDAAVVGSRANVSYSDIDELWPAMLAAAPHRASSSHKTPSREEVARIIAPEVFAEGYVRLYPDRSTIEQYTAFQKADAILSRASSSHEALRTALEPFAEIADAYDVAYATRVKQHVDEGRAPGPPLADHHRVSISIGECRAARRALSDTERQR